MTPAYLVGAMGQIVKQIVAENVARSGPRPGLRGSPRITSRHCGGIDAQRKLS